MCHEQCARNDIFLNYFKREEKKEVSVDREKQLRDMIHRYHSW